MKYITKSEFDRLPENIQAKLKSGHIHVPYSHNDLASSLSKTLKITPAKAQALVGKLKFKEK
ncbi:hypothetical protein [Streptococcus suis]|uniref:hypothetical protein n=1 Tax=Streptococcus suis TaxID=1307 RepID=UPI000409DBE8|nr:hypothetical protein [Streptococcus suis]QBX21851.1 hypothetical protein Javan597_0063 [Streptococcus phage Javan597]MBM7180451.1 hypothetical protein [Streptococcus suis]MBM7204472.1 hypothetical protein [Streptococcus suis]MBO4115026.1 hypothetical protein [Streptococcus suis]MBO4117144.1 hypothetical protein [Streptococcus suis]